MRVRPKLLFPRNEFLGGKEFVYTSSSLVVAHKQKPPTTPFSTPLPREIRNSSFLLLHSGPNSKMHRTYSMRQSRAPTASQIQNPPPPVSSTKTGRFFGKTNIGELLSLFNSKGVLEHQSRASSDRSVVNPQLDPSIGACDRITRDIPAHILA